MTTIRIAPGPVRQTGLAAVTVADDLQAQAGQLASIAMPAMPPAMAAEHQSALSAIGSRLTAASSALGQAGAELQVRAAAAEAADTPGAGRSAGAAMALKAAVVSTTQVVLRGGLTETARLVVSRTGVQATTSASGLRVTMPELTRAGPTVMTSSNLEPRDAQLAAASNPATDRDTSSGRPVEGPPAAAVHQAVGSGGGGGDPLDPAPAAAQSLTAGDAVDPSAPAPASHHAEAAAHSVPVPTDMPSHADAQRQDWACWMAGAAAHHGLPPALPVMLALSQSGLRNTPSGSEDVGFFGLDPRSSYAPAGHGHSRDQPPDGDWWADHPSAQLDEVIGRLRGAEGGVREASLDDPEALSRWAADAIPELDATTLSDAHLAATTLVDGCKQTAGAPVGRDGSDALSVARSQLGVHEVGTNAGPKVNEYLTAAQVGSGNPWCASFVAWSLQQTGHEMPGTGWAAVATWVNAAENQQHGLQIVDAAHARPGDIVAYDWGGDSNFGSDGHIGFLDSRVEGGRFTAVEGNAQDAVTRMDRNTGMGNVVFIRAGG